MKDFKNIEKAKNYSNRCTLKEIENPNNRKFLKVSGENISTCTSTEKEINKNNRIIAN